MAAAAAAAAAATSEPLESFSLRRPHNRVRLRAAAFARSALLARHQSDLSSHPRRLWPRKDARRRRRRHNRSFGSESHRARARHLFACTITAIGANERALSYLLLKRSSAAREHTSGAREANRIAWLSHAREFVACLRAALISTRKCCWPRACVLVTPAQIRCEREERPGRAAFGRMAFVMRRALHNAARGRNPRAVCAAVAAAAARQVG